MFGINSPAHCPYFRRILTRFGLQKHFRENIHPNAPKPWTAKKPNTFNIKNQQQEPKFYNVLHFLHSDFIRSRLSETVRILGRISGSSSVQFSAIWNAATTCFFAYTLGSNARSITLLPWTYFQGLNSCMYIKPAPVPWAIFNLDAHISRGKELEGPRLPAII